jgi:hypothetical protein
VTLTALIDTPAKNLPLNGAVMFSFTPRFSGTPSRIPGTATLTQTTDAQGNSALQAVLTFVPSSNLEDVFATFVGDSNYLLSTSNGFTIGVTGNDFALVMNSAPLIMPAGTTGVDGFDIDAESGYNGTATFTAAGLPEGAAATFMPTSVTGSGQIFVQISTTGPHAAFKGGIAQTALLATIIPFFAVVLIGPRRRKRPLLPLILFSLLTAAVSCGGSSGGGTGGGGGNGGTPPGNYTVTITVTSNTGISHSAMFPLVIQ